MVDQISGLPFGLPPASYAFAPPPTAHPPHPRPRWRCSRSSPRASCCRPRRCCIIAHRCCRRCSSGAGGKTGCGYTAVRRTAESCCSRNRAADHAPRGARGPCGPDTEENCGPSGYGFGKYAGAIYGTVAGVTAREYCFAWGG